MINYEGKQIQFNGCPGCAYARHEFELPCGMAYENEHFTLSQDWELPIEGFFIVSPTKHVEKLEELTTEESVEMFDIVNSTIKVLRRNNICDHFEVVFEEKENRHLHVWIMPRHEWMKDEVGNIINNIGTIFEYAKQNFRDEDTYKKIKDATSILKKEFRKTHLM